MSVRILLTSHDRCWSVGSLPYLLCHLSSDLRVCKRLRYLVWPARPSAHQRTQLPILCSPLDWCQTRCLPVASRCPVWALVAAAIQSCRGHDHDDDLPKGPLVNGRCTIVLGSCYAWRHGAQPPDIPNFEGRKKLTATAAIALGRARAQSKICQLSAQLDVSAGAQLGLGLGFITGIDKLSLATAPWSHGNMRLYGTLGLSTWNT